MTNCPFMLCVLTRRLCGEYSVVTLPLTVFVETTSCNVPSMVVRRARSDGCVGGVGTGSATRKRTIPSSTTGAVRYCPSCRIPFGPVVAVGVSGNGGKTCAEAAALVTTRSAASNATIRTNGIRSFVRTHTPPFELYSPCSI
jgi:hypothetical protein